MMDEWAARYRAAHTTCGSCGRTLETHHDRHDRTWMRCPRFPRNPISAMFTLREHTCYDAAFPLVGMIWQ